MAPRTLSSRGTWRRTVLAGLLLTGLLDCEASLAAPKAENPDSRFVSIALHDVVDPGQPADVDSVSVGKLIDVFERLKADGWSPISIADLDAARTGLKPLPAKPILLTFDDGYSSFYTRVYPLLLAYRYPAVLALVGQWMDAPAGGVVDYGGRPMPREHFVTWDQVRRMQASGLVEIASHSYGLHQSIPIDARGTSAAAARSWAYDPGQGSPETDGAHRRRIHEDLVRSRDLIARETGQAPGVLVWPFGRYSGPAQLEARAVGFSKTLTLEPAAADARHLTDISRYYPTRDPALHEILADLEFRPSVAPLRAACVDLAPMQSAPDAAGQEHWLGQAIEAIRSLGANIAIVDLGGAPANGQRTVGGTSRDPPGQEAEILSRALRQIAARGGADVYVRVPLAQIGEAAAIALAQRTARLAPITGLVLDGEGFAPGVSGGSGQTPAPALRVMRAALEIDPTLRLMIASDKAGAMLPDGADLVLWPPAADLRGATAQAARLEQAGGAPLAAKVLLSVPRTGVKEQVAAMRAMSAQGATAFAICPWAFDQAAQLAPAFSAATFPLKP